MNVLRPVACIALALVSASDVHAQTAATYPTKPIKLISPYPPGGGTDAAARIIAQALSDQLGQQVIVDTRGGASGLIGTELAAKSAADGYTIVLGNVAPLAILPAATPKLPYDPIRNFAPISLVALSDYVLAVHPSVPVKSLKELLALAKNNPDKLTYASSGNLGAPHLAGELMNLLAHVNTVHIPYKGNGPAAIGVMSDSTVRAAQFGLIRIFVETISRANCRTSSLARGPAPGNLPRGPQASAVASDDLARRRGRRRRRARRTAGRPVRTGRSGHQPR